MTSTAWPASTTGSGMSSSGAASVMDRLDAIVQRPLVDIVPVYAGQRRRARTTTTTRRPPCGARRSALRVEQTLANGSTPSRTVFGLRRHFGCWWVQSVDAITTCERCRPRASGKIAASPRRTPTMQYPEWIWHNGAIKPWAEATTHVMSHALHYGSSVFEGIRSYDTPERRRRSSA